MWRFLNVGSNVLKDAPQGTDMNEWQQKIKKEFRNLLGTFYIINLEGGMGEIPPLSFTWVKSLFYTSSYLGLETSMGVLWECIKRHIFKYDAQRGLYESEASEKHIFLELIHEQRTLYEKVKFDGLTWSKQGEMERKEKGERINKIWEKLLLGGDDASLFSIDLF